MESSSHAYGTTSNYKIAVVDDDKLTGIALIELLNVLGYQATLLPSPRQAMLQFGQNTPDLIFMDINMPGVNGYELCRYLKREPATRHIPIVFVSARSAAIDKERGFEVGASDFLTKPVSMNTMQSCIEKIRSSQLSANPTVSRKDLSMPRFPIIEASDVTDPRVKAIYDEIIAELGFGIVPNLFKSMATNPDFLEANWKQFRGTILRGDFPRTLKEMIGVVISQKNNSQYALRVHLHGLSALGMSEEVLRTLVSDFNACPLPEREKAVITFGLRAGTTPQALTDDDYKHLHDLGLDDGEIFEIIATANLFVGVNQYTDSTALEIDKL
jgi:uncharacterized peroxidase-related enzyme